MPAIHPTVLIAALMGASLAASAQDHGAHHAPEPAASSARATAAAGTLPWVDAEVRRVDSAAGKLTLRHGDIPNLSMPAMSMTFQVRDPAMLATLQAGDRVRVTIDRVQGAYTVLALEKNP